MRVLFFILTIAILCATCESYRILGIFTLPARSHMMMFEKVMKGLAKAGHTVDVISTFPLEKPLPRYNDISIKEIVPIMTDTFDTDYLDKKFGSIGAAMDTILDDLGKVICEAVFNSTIFQDLKTTKVKYDILLTEMLGADCHLGFAYIFKIPAISLTSSVDFPWGAVRVGNPVNPSYIPNYFSHYSNKMSFVERFLNTFHVLNGNWKRMKVNERTNEIARAFFGNDLPDLEDLAKQTNLVLVNSHFSINYPRPVVPNCVEVGGIHIDDLKPLPDKFSKFLNVDSSFKGVIYFNMGSLTVPETFPKEILEALFDTLGKFPYKVLWKSKKENMPRNVNIPSNIFFESWVPQRDILCHPSVKLFISHGGLGGTQEAVHCGVPVLGIPLFADQRLNVKSLVENKVALQMDYDSITKDVFMNLLTRILEPEFAERAKKVSELFRDRPMSPLKTAIYWVEYVIRHNGALHLRSSGADLPWYQYYLVDVGIVFILLVSVLLFIAQYIIQSVFRLSVSRL